MQLDPLVHIFIAGSIIAPLYRYLALVGFADLSSTQLEEIVQGHCKFSHFRVLR